LATAVGVSATGNAEIDGLLSGAKWSGSITFSFPDSPSDYASSGYSPDNEPAQAGFAQAPAAMQAAIHYAVALIQGYTNIQISFAGTGGADLQIAQSPAANPTSYAYYPGNYSAGGDIWFGTGYNYSGAKNGNYLFATALHELGHALGLKHSQETGGPGNVAVPYAHDNSEYSIMSYRSYAGAPLTGYTAETYGFSQTYMANDILAMQTMYGANYNTQSTNTTYTWSTTTGQMFINGAGQLAPGDGTGGSQNRVFETIWDGNGIDTYDMSNYSTSVSINLNPGASSVTSSAQLAYLGNGHYAAGNVYNAYLFGSDPRSYIENAIGGSAGDTIVGNAIANNLNGGGGNDTITGGAGNDTIVGGSGTDKAVYSGNRSNYLITYNAATQTFTIVDQRGNSPDGTDTVTGVENFQFADGTFADTTLMQPPVVIESNGATSLVVSGSNYYLNPLGGGTGPVLQFQGAVVTAGQFAGWAPIGAEATANGYQVAWYNAGTNQYTFWYTDGSGKFVSNPTGLVAGSSSAVQSFESSFNQDLNGDGVIGAPVAPPPPPSTAIESAGATSLVVSGNNYYLNPVGGGTGPVLQFQGSVVSVGQFAGWAPIGAEATANGYEVAWYNAGTNQYTFWYTDGTGKFVSNPTGLVAGSSSAVQTFESSFNQDLNGDGVIGAPVAPPPPPSTAIESAGATSLVVSGNNYYLNPVGGGTGPVLQFQGSVVSVGQFAGWAPIGAEATANGYEVAWYNAGTNQYTFWYTDGSGKFFSNPTGLVAGSSSAVQTFESSFNQDLNGDGVIGAPVAPPPSTAIESAGATSLMVSGNNYYLNPVGGGTGPVLQFQGSVVTVGKFAGWAPIGAEATANGYEVAWYNAGTNQYTFWYTDGSGKFVSNPTGPVAGNSSAVLTFESSFQQDLNGDGTISQQSLGAASLFAGLDQSDLVFKFGSDGLPAPDLHVLNGRMADYSSASPLANEVRPVIDIGVEHLPTAAPESDNAVLKVLAAHFDQLLFH